MAIEKGKAWFNDVLLTDAAKDQQALDGWENPEITALSPGHKANMRSKLLLRRNSDEPGCSMSLGLGARAGVSAPPEPWQESGEMPEKLDDFLMAARRRAVEGVDRDVGNLGMGSLFIIEDITEKELQEFEPVHDDSHKIPEFPSTAICGNDITSSCFYVVGEISKTAGVYAPICTILSSFTLWCFRGVYGEVVMALPLNGGIYNLLLNTSSKQTASVTACLTILSYTATGVVSSVSAGEYLQYSPMCSGLNTVPIAISILAFFAALMLMGMQESSFVATLLFIFHLSVLFMLTCMCLLFVADQGLGQFYSNLHWPKQPPAMQAIFYGFSSAMLGVSGFETSANFVEEQKPGVFPKTLRNMWVSVSIINIVMPAIASCVMTMDELNGPESGYSLAFMANRVAGPIMRDVVVADALLCLAGAVLTSYVGVVGLFQRMAGDRCLPEFFSITNSWRGTPHYTILVFFGVCSSMCVILDGDITQLGAIYSISFLLVMGLFAFCGLMTKITRPTLPRQIQCHPARFIIGLTFVCIAFTAVVMIHPDVLAYFYIYYGITTIVVMTTFVRASVLTAFIGLLNGSWLVRSIIKRFLNMDSVHTWTVTKLQKLRNQGVVYYTKHANMSELNRAMQYVEQNEDARWVRIVHCYENPELIPEHLLEYTQLLDCVYPKIKVDCILVQSEFGPAIVHCISKRLNVPINCMFMNCPRTEFQHRLDRMGGVRIILNSEKASLLDSVNPFPQTSEAVVLETPVSTLERRSNASSRVWDSYVVSPQQFESD